MSQKARRKYKKIQGIFTPLNVLMLIFVKTASNIPPAAPHCIKVDPLSIPETQWSKLADFFFSRGRVIPNFDFEKLNTKKINQTFYIFQKYDIE